MADKGIVLEGCEMGSTADECVECGGGELGRDDGGDAREKGRGRSG